MMKSTKFYLIRLWRMEGMVQKIVVDELFQTVVGDVHDNLLRKLSRYSGQLVMRKDPSIALALGSLIRLASDGPSHAPSCHYGRR